MNTLETRYNLNNNSNQVRVIEVENFDEYIDHILESNLNHRNSNIINSVDNYTGCTLGRTENFIIAIMNLERSLFIMILLDVWY